MDFIMALLKAFFVGGALCAIGQVLLLKTNLTSARILVLYVTCGVVLSAVGVYGPLAEWAGAGATVPLLGFGHALCAGTLEAVREHGLYGVISGGIIATAAGVAAAIVFGYISAIIFNPNPKGKSLVGR